jgi:hypothetical protein
VVVLSTCATATAQSNANKTIMLWWRDAREF